MEYPGATSYAAGADDALFMDGKTGLDALGDLEVLADRGDEAMVVEGKD